MTYRPDIDGLRAIAVLSVVFCHTGLALPGGFVGVDVFFVISGYLIAGLMMKELELGTFSLVNFWERRIRRILPALVVVVATSAVAGWFILIPRSYESFGRSVVQLTLIRANRHFARNTDYFADVAEQDPLLHTWSLAVEEQFYLLVPLLFWGAYRLRRTKLLRPLVGVLLVVSFALAAKGASAAEPRAYYLLTTRAWELLVGALTAILMRDAVVVSRLVREYAAVCGLLGIVIPCLVYNKLTPFPGPAALPPVLGAALLIAAGNDAVRPTFVRRLLAARPAVAIGLISYSLYLWHWPLIVFFKYRSGHAASAVECGLIVAASAVLAALTYRGVELPFRHRVRLPARPRLFAAAAVAFLLLLAVGHGVQFRQGWIGRLPPTAQRFARTSRWDDRFLCQHTVADVPDNLIRAGADGLAPRLLVWGDSHAMVIMPAVDERCRAAGIAVAGAVHSVCPPLVGHPDETRDQTAANAFNAAVLRYVQSADIQAVILAAWWRNYSTQPRFVELLLRTADELRASGVTVYFMKDVPGYNCDVGATLTRCAWFGRDPGSLSQTVKQYERDNDFHDAVLPLLRDRGVIILDPIPLMRTAANSNQIRPFDAGGSWYRDGTHLSIHGARAISAVFTPVVDAVAAQASVVRPRDDGPPATVAAPITTTRR